jgi:hypothetical protein
MSFFRSESKCCLKSGHLEYCMNILQFCAGPNSEIVEIVQLIKSILGFKNHSLLSPFSFSKVQYTIASIL